MVDSTDRRRLDETSEELGFLLEEEKLAGIPVMVFANKQDLVTALPHVEVFLLLLSVEVCNKIGESLELHRIRNRQWHIQACSGRLASCKI